MSDPRPEASPGAGQEQLRSGRVQRVVIRALGLVLGVVVALFSMSARPALPGGVWIGLIGVGVAVFSAVAWAGEAERSEPSTSVALGDVVRPGVGALVALFVLWLGVRLGVLGVVPKPAIVLGLVVPLSLIAAAAALGSLLGRLGFLADPERPLWLRHGLWLVVLTTLLYVPRLGSFGLIDPWETHYGEVAREMLSRDDWISLWWAQDGWFWSKPILNFWAQGLSFSIFGVAWQPDQMIAAAALGREPMPEWAARLPVFGLALIGQQLLYIGARAYVGRLAAFLGILVLVTMPYWYLLARQSVADMVYVAPLCGAMGALLLAFASDPDARARTVGLRFGSSPASQLRLSGYPLLFGCVLVVVVPVLVYLVSRNMTFQWAEFPPRLVLHVDRVLTGSPVNCGLPGNAGCREDKILGLWRQPALAAVGWSLCTALFLWLRRRERRLKRLYYLAAWLLAGLSFMGKGAPGLVLVLFAFGGFVVARGRFSELKHADALGFVLCMACVVMPWFVQEYARHGSEFFERLFIHDMYKRAFDHVHDTNKGDDTSFRYYVWQLGYGLYPWSGLAAAGTLWCLGRASEEPAATPGGGAPAVQPLTDLTYFCVAWQLGAFGMFSITGTKFHHYILPLVPAAALMTGALLASWLNPSAEKRSAALSAGCLGLGAAVVVGLAGRDLSVTRAADVDGPARLLHLITYNYSRSWPDSLDYRRLLMTFTILASLACALMVWPRVRRWAVLASLGLGIAVSGWATNVYVVQLSPHFGQRETIEEYYRRRAGPQEPLVAYQLNWKGENFYTGNNVPAFVSSGKRFTDWVEAQKKKGVAVMFFTTEHSRVKALERELGKPRAFELLTNASLNDKFVLARAVL
jgi:4-amino-4-deoxy-L-arabinose transferase-like glycosyltransferase